jgi:hypothetical protein
MISAFIVIHFNLEQFVERNLHDTVAVSNLECACECPQARRTAGRVAIIFMEL